jgi:hypothetical protein
MNTGMGIVLLVVFAIGAASVLFWVAKQAARAYRSFYVKEASQVAKKPKYLRVGHLRTLTNYDDLPQYKGDTGLFGLPRYRDVVVPDKHNYKTVVYMDHPVKQYVYDVMASWKGVSSDNRFWPFWIFLIVGAYFFKPIIGFLAAIFLFWFMFWMSPSGDRAVRRMAENAKDFTPDTWRGIYRDVAESIEREDEMVRALRRSGVRRL